MRNMSVRRSPRTGESVYYGKASWHPGVMPYPRWPWGGLDYQPEWVWGSGQPIVKDEGDEQPLLWYDSGPDAPPSVPQANQGLIYPTMWWPSGGRILPAAMMRTLVYSARWRYEIDFAGRTWEGEFDAGALYRHDADDGPVIIRPGDGRSIRSLVVGDAPPTECAWQLSDGLTSVLSLNIDNSDVRAGMTWTENPRGWAVARAIRVTIVDRRHTPQHGAVGYAYGEPSGLTIDGNPVRLAPMVPGDPLPAISGRIWSISQRPNRG